MKYALAAISFAIASTPALADEAAAPAAPAPRAVAAPTVALTQAELAQLGEEVGTMAVLTFLAKEAQQKSAEVDAKVANAFRSQAAPVAPVTP